MRGRDKLLEDVGGISLLRHQALKCRDITDKAVIVALPPAPHARYDALAGLDVTPLPVADAGKGMNASLAAAITALPDDTACVMVLLADLPDLEKQDLEKVAAAVDLKGTDMIWRGATMGGAPGHPVVFRSDLFAGLIALTGDSGGREVVAAYKDKTLLVPLPDDRARADLDTPEQWAVWRKARRTAD